MKERSVRVRHAFLTAVPDRHGGSQDDPGAVTAVVTHTIEVFIPDKLAFEQYLRACEIKEAAPRYSRMGYAFPGIREACPVCKAADCARWRGYYRRLIFCTEMEELRRIYVRVGRCRATGDAFSAVPSFLFDAGG